MKRTMMKIEDMGEVQSNIIEATCKYLTQHPNINSLVLGMSGGIDSAVTGILAKQVCERMDTDLYGHRKIELIIRSLPIISNSPGEMERARVMGSMLTENFSIINLDTVYNNVKEGFNHVEVDDYTDHNYRVRMGNIKARVRMMYLYNLASLFNGMVLSTDNYTELLLGFWTLHGDVGDYGMIQNLWKTEVYMLAAYYADMCRMKNEFELENIIMSCITAVPTDGLGITKSDMDQFGDIKTYKDVDDVFIDILTNGYSNLIKRGGQIPKVLTMHENTMFKRNNPFNIPREVIIGKEW